MMCREGYNNRCDNGYNKMASNVAGVAGSGELL